MGKNPGVPDGYDKAPVAIVNGKPVGNERDHHDHSFFGPGYSIAHPGIFPHNPEAERWTIDEWLQFDYRAEWGSEDFEIAVIDGEIDIEFPEAWAGSGRSRRSLAHRRRQSRSSARGEERASRAGHEQWFQDRWSVLR